MSKVLKSNGKSKLSPKIILLIIFFIIVLAPLILNYYQDKSLVIGKESYFNLAQANQMNLSHWYNYHFYLISHIVPESVLPFIPLILSMVIVILFLNLAEKLEMDNKLTSLFLLLLALCPSTILVLAGLSAYSIFLIFSLSGFLLLQQNGKWSNYVAIIFFILATFIDTASGILLLIFQVIYFFKVDGTKNNDNNKLSNEKTNWRMISITTLSIIFATLILKIPLSIGPFHAQQKFNDFISDLGSFSGMSIFILLLFVMGLLLTWEQKDYSIYPLLAVSLTFTLLNTYFIFFLVIIIAFIIVKGGLILWEKKWKLPELKTFTFLLIILGLVFSTITYVDRLSQSGVYSTEVDALTWIEENSPPNAIILSLPENGETISYFTQRKIFYSFQQNSGLQYLDRIPLLFQLDYIKDLFPELEKENIHYLYINQKMREDLPAERGLLYLLKNERFKLAYSSKGAEVWIFE